ncbi:MAG: V-type ATP synthase subunit A [Chlamydiota bacterium]|jgi:V/A-type H+-transporting ATPase subunit A
MQNQNLGKGTVLKALGNLLQVRFEGNIRQGEMSLIKVDEDHLSAEVIEVVGDEVKLQVFEDTTGVKLGSSVEFLGHLLEAELGPGLLTTVYDGLQNPLEKVAEKTGLYLKRGVYLKPIDRDVKWEFTPKCEVNQSVQKGDLLGTVKEGHFEHKIMVPFQQYGSYTVTWVAKQGSYTVEETLVKAKDEKGNEVSFNMLQKWPVKTPLIHGKKVKPSEMMDTGLRILDTQFPVLKGGTFCSPGPFGAGKTVLQHHLSKYSSVDIVIVVACGERAGEVVEMLKTFPELTDARTSEPLMNRTVIICNTSSMPVAAREASVYMGATIAEYYRQMGLDVLLLADSTSRWAQAMREMSGRLEEIPGEEAFPAYLASRIASFYERSGVIQLPDGEEGSLTIGGSVSPAGGNFEEPVTQSSLSVVGAFHGLSRARSDARRYPAVDPLISWSKYIDSVGEELNQKLEHWASKVKKGLKFLVDGDEIGKRMEVVGEEGISIDDMIIYLKAELYDISYLQQNAFDKEDAFCPLERQVELFQLVQEIFDTHFVFDSHDEARSFFLFLQNLIKNTNYLPYGSNEYKNNFREIKEKIQEARHS